ncbi:hypothetical protein, partial [Caldibacillus thermoamylovorans]|uniref:hypothetical protein n=1 Tax=Caldibacillus thermoamylovorans TaxID=35841 RepID=UPI00203CC7CB
SHNWENLCKLGLPSDLIVPKDVMFGKEKKLSTTHKNKLSTFLKKNKQIWFFLTLFVIKFNWKILPTVDKS